MKPGRKAAVSYGNRLLGLLPSRDYRQLRPHLEQVPLKHGQSLYRADEPIEFVYFIETGLGSLVSAMTNGKSAEVGTIGNEGMVGLPLALGDDRGSSAVYVSVAGVGLRMKAARFTKEMRRSATLRAVMSRYAHAFFAEVAKLAACHRFHTIEQRYCRWLLGTADCMQAVEFPLTQEFMAKMLGVQRTGVTLTANALRSAGLIRYTRGRVSIIDRRGLERRSCECYRVIKRDFDHLLQDRGTRKIRSPRRVKLGSEAVAL